MRPDADAETTTAPGSRSAPFWLRDTPGAVLNLLRTDDRGLTKSQISRASGLSRTAVNQRIDVLLAHGLVEATINEIPAAGRPADRFHVAAKRGVLLLADMGVTGMRVALCDLAAVVLEEVYQRITITDGPVDVLSQVVEVFDRFLRLRGLNADHVVGIGLNVPGPVDHKTGRVMNPPTMTGWHDYDIAGHLQDRFAVPVVIEKDANAMVFGEHRLVYPHHDDLVFVKLGTGLATGLIVNGQIYRGADGAAGDIGHIPFSADDDDAPLCRCGNRGCVEAYASGWALIRDLRAIGHQVESIDDVIQATANREPDALRLTHQAAQIIGRAVSDLVNIVNPRTIVFGGQFAGRDDLIIAGVREVVYRRSLPLATRNLAIVGTALSETAGVHGLAQLVSDEVFAASRIDALVRSTTRP